MLSPKEFYEYLESKGINFYTGVPDSLLKSFCGYISDHAKESNNIIAANEGGAIGLAIGYHLATQNIPLVYMQNSGLGNSINPILSLADQEIYSIPMVLLIGWRGEPEVKDEPQHLKQGRVMIPMLESMEIPYEILSGEITKDRKIIDGVLNKIKKLNCPYALIARKGIFEDYQYKVISNVKHSLSREEAIKMIVNSLEAKDFVVSTTGMASREIYEYREELKQDHGSDFLTVGGMGHASQIALGIASNRPDRHVVCIDGDGAALMHLGSLAINASRKCKNFKHIVINNGCHGSVGGQPTVAFDIDLGKICRNLGYKVIENDNSTEGVLNSLKELLLSEGPSFLEIRVNKDYRNDLGRPSSSPKENKLSFLKNLI